MVYKLCSIRFFSVHDHQTRPGQARPDGHVAARYMLCTNACRVFTTSRKEGRKEVKKGEEPPPLLHPVLRSWHFQSVARCQ